MSCRRCRYQHGVADGLCEDCRRWDSFTMDELDRLGSALSGKSYGRALTKVRLEILAAIVDRSAGGAFPDLVRARHAVSETGG